MIWTRNTGDSVVVPWVEKMDKIAFETAAVDDQINPPLAEPHYSATLMLRKS